MNSGWEPYESGYDLLQEAMNYLETRRVDVPMGIVYQSDYESS